MTSLPFRLAEAKQLLNACRWSITEVHQDSGKIIYMVFDPTGIPRRSFVPVDRLWDYARGVFDAQEWD